MNLMKRKWALPHSMGFSRESVKSDGETGKSTHSSIGGKIASATASIASHKSVLSQHSKRSGASGYELISYPRQDLQFVMLLGRYN